MSEEDKQAFLVINLGVKGTKSFISIEEFQQWLGKEREFWKWPPELQRQDRNFLSQIETRSSQFYNPINTKLNEIRNLQDEDQVKTRAKQISSHIQAQMNRQSIVLSDSAEGDFISDLRQDNPLLAAYTAGGMMGIQMNPSIQGSVEGQFLSIAFKYGYHDRTKNERSALQNLQAEWRELLEQSKAKFEATSTQYDELVAQYEQQMASQKTAFEEFTTLSKTEFDDLINDSKNQLRRIEKTYDEKLALQAAVQYWKNKAISHGSVAVKLSWACGIVGVIVAIFLGIETFIAVGPLQKISDLPLWKGAILLLTAIIGVWSIRVLVRLLLSNLHLKSDAVERRTMLLTYLALLRRGQGPKEEQRELILQVLFRPSATGIVKDDALPPIIAQWLNTITS